METYRRHSLDKKMLYATIILMVIGLVMIMSASGVYAEQAYQKKLYFFLQRARRIRRHPGPARDPSQHPPAGLQEPGRHFRPSRPDVRPASPGPFSSRRSPGPTGGSSWAESASSRRNWPNSAWSCFWLGTSTASGKKSAEFRTLLAPMGVVVLFTFLIIREPDFGTAVLILVLCLVVLFVGGVRPKHFAVMSAALAPPFFFISFGALPRQPAHGLLLPANERGKPQFSGRPIQARGRLGRAVRREPRESVQKMFFLPCSHTDFIFAIIGEETGLIGTLILVFRLLLPGLAGDQNIDERAGFLQPGRPPG